MRRFFCAFCMIFLLTAVSAASADLKIGTLTRGDNDQFTNAAPYFSGNTSLFSHRHSEKFTYTFFDNMNSMLMALDNGLIDEVDTFAVNASYILSSTNKYKLTCIDYNDTPSYFSFGLLNDKLRQEINSVLREMKADGSLTQIILNATTNGDTTAVDFEKFADAPEIKIALTGDIPPLDFVKADGTPAGFNTAILAEIGRRLKANMIPVNIDTGAKTAALTSGRVDVVFWYLDEYGDNPVNYDAPEGVLLTEPYYEFHDYMHIARRTD